MEQRVRRMGRRSMGRRRRSKMGKRHYPSLVALLLEPTPAPALSQSKSSRERQSREKGSKREYTGTSSGERSRKESSSSSKHRQISPSSPTIAPSSPSPSHRPSLSPTDQTITPPTSHIPSQAPTLRATMFPPSADIRDNVPCSSTQTSTGAGTTVLSIDVLRPAGSFLLQYDMLEEPDSLVIEYEGQTIFTTGGPVAFSADFFVTLPSGGTSSIVRAIIAAAPTNRGATEWELTIGCVSRR